jgi:endonuclease YncB( thermonuclease family)
MADRFAQLGNRYCAAIIIATATAASAVFAHPPAAEVRVIDGDTLQIGEIRYRLFGIDAPEGSQTCESGGGLYRCGDTATRALVALIGSGTVTCSRVNTDRYGRTVAACEAGGRDLGAEMVRAGQAVAFVRYSKRYLPEQADAQAHNRGLWSGAFVMPWEWRKAH